MRALVLRISSSMLRRHSISARRYNRCAAAPLLGIHRQAATRPSSLSKMQDAHSGYALEAQYYRALIQEGLGRKSQ